MAKKIPSDKTSPEKVDIIIDSQQWETSTNTMTRFTWRHGLILSLIIGGVLLFAFGFLIIASVILVAAIIINTILFIVRKLT